MYWQPFRVIKHCVLGLFIGTLALSAALSQHTSVKVDFRRDVQPLLKQYCIECHGPSQQMHGFRLDRRRDAMRGGTITVITPGNSEGSRFYLKLISNKYGPQMPPTGPLTSEQIEIIKAWIDQGAEWPDDLAGEIAPAPPDPKATQILRALREGDKQAFRKLISGVPKAGDLKGPGSTTPLMQAVLYGDTESVRLLLDKGADPNIRNEAGATALMWAVDDLEKTRLLIERKADVNARSGDGRTPLLIAAGQFGSGEVVKLLLDRGAELSAKSPTVVGYATVLSEAARMGDDSLLRMLIKRGANLKSAGLGPFANANRVKCAKCLDTLIEHSDRRTLTQASVLLSPPFGDASAIKTFIDSGAEANATDPKGNTVLMLAASSDAVPVEGVSALIERGVDVSAKNPEGRTALDFAKLRGPSPIVDLLVKAGAKEGAPPTNPPSNYKPAPSARAAFERSIPLLQKADSVFIQKSGCVSCHHNTLTAVTVSIGRKNGLPVNEQIASEQLKRIASYIETWRERALLGVGIPGESGAISNILVGLAAEGYPGDAATDALARFVALQQWPDGRWRPFAHRPPGESSEVKVTAISIRSLQVYGPKVQRARYEAAVKRAADWLAKAEPERTQDRAFQLLGLAWAGVKADDELIKKGVRNLIAQQRPDGGWSQLPTLASDAYATGEALVALKQAGALPATDPAYKRGVEFLLKTQLEDGSWYVRSRIIPLQPYFDGGFPHGNDQWVSAAATNWAAMALALTVDKQR